MIILNGGIIFDKFFYYSRGITSVSFISLSLTPAQLVNSQISSGLLYNRYPLNPYRPWSWGGFGNAGRDFWKFFYISKGLDAAICQGFIIGTFSIPIILGKFSYISESLKSHEISSFLFVSQEYLNSFRLLFGSGAIQSIDSIIIRKSDLNINPSSTAESLLVKLFIRGNLLLNQNPSIFYWGKTTDNQVVSSVYWFQIFELAKVDEDNNDDPFSDIDLGDL